MLVENPIPVGASTGDQKYFLVQLRHILKQTGQFVSSQNVGRRVLFFLLRLLQELSPLCSIFMKLYLALSEKGPNSVEFKATTHFGSKNNNELSNFCPNPSVSLFQTGDQNNRDLVKTASQDLLAKSDPKKLSLFGLLMKRKQAAIDDIARKRPRMDCDNLVADQALTKLNSQLTSAKITKLNRSRQMEIN